MREHGDPETIVEVTPASTSVTSSVGSTTVGTLWTLAHESEGTVSLNVGPHPHGFELRVILNNRFLRSRVHREFAGVLADATDTRERFEELGFAEAPRPLRALSTSRPPTDGRGAAGLRPRPHSPRLIPR